MATIRYHEDVHGYAVNVKTLHMHFAEGGTEGQRELAWDYTHADWWNDADEIARQEGFDGAAACGRSFGWCAPYDVNRSVPENRSNHYMYVDDEGDERFPKFAERIEEHLKDVPTMYKENLERIIKEDKARVEAAKQDAEDLAVLKAETLDFLRIHRADQLVEAWKERWGIKA